MQVFREQSGTPGGIETSPLIQALGGGEPPFMTNGKLRRPDGVGEPFCLSHPTLPEQLPEAGITIKKGI